MFYLNLPAPPTWDNELGVAAAESAAAHEIDRLYSFVRHARISRSAAREFWPRVEALFREFTDLPRGDEVCGLLAGLYPTEHPTLGPPDAAPAARGPRSRRDPG